MNIMNSINSMKYMTNAPILPVLTQLYNDCQTAENTQNNFVNDIISVDFINS